LISKITIAAANIEYGRKGFATRGKAEEGRLSYERGILKALSVFKDAQSTSDPKAIFLIEYTFINQDLQFCDESDTGTISSLTQAIESFDDAFLVLKIVENKDSYRITDISIPRHKDYRVKKIFPKDSFHVACGSHRTRLQNFIRTPGIDPIEKALIKQRMANMITAQNGYIDKQKKVLQCIL